MNSQLDTMLAAQNAELIKALAEKTLALDDKTRDIAIEAALEKVRSRSLAMRKSDELQEVINTIYEQLLELDVKMDSVNFIIFYKGRRDFDLWLAEPRHIYSSCMYIPEIDFFPTKQLFDAVEKGVDFFTMTCSTEEKNTWFSYAFEHSGLKQTTPERREMVLGAKCWTIAWSIYSHSAVQLNSYSRDSFSNTEHDILKRFAKVFEQAYIRFLDVQKAEEQARESQIQLALERVRSRSIAMQKSGELAEVIQLVFEQFVHLGFKINVATFNMDYRADNNFRLWIASAYQRYPSMVFTPYLDHPVFNIPSGAIDAGSDHFVTKLTLSEKNQYLDHFFKNSSPIPDLPADMLEHIYNAPGYDSYGVLMKTVALTVTNYLGYAYTEAEEAVVMRFGKVFEQTYTRFLDLKKAEEQTREANIEAALERVRSRTMAMQKSEELAKVIQVIFDQFVGLNFTINAANFNTDVGDYKSGNGLQFWIASKNANYPTKIYHPYLDHPAFNIAIAAKDSGSDHFIVNLTAEEKKQFWDYFFNNTSPLPDITPEIRDRMYAAPGYYSYTAIIKTVSLSILNYAGYAYTEAEQAVVMRFCKVFEQTYTRFKDLEQAEAQAREGQIQLALERVRSRTMAMQKSEELADVIKIVFDQFVVLNFNISAANFSTDIRDYRANNGFNVWIAATNVNYPTKIFHPYFDHPVFNVAIDALNNDSDHCIINLTAEEKNQFWDYYFNDTSPLPDFPLEDRDRVYNTPGYYSYTVLLKTVSLSILNFQGYAFTEAEEAVAMRFAKVFEQTYTRFKDLQKAEAQARESQIEAALERVRSRTMGMQKSDELGQVIQLIYEQFIQLGLKIDGAGFALDYMDSDDFNFWIANSYSVFPNKLHTPYFDHPQFNRYKEAKEKGLGFYTSGLTFEEKNTFIDHVIKNLPSFPPELLEMVYGAPGWMTSHVILKNVILYVQNLTGIPFTDAENATLMRFGKMFEQTYTRFNDLQKAEAQAREAQIETSLERVRSRTMGMQKSDELREVIQVIYDQFVLLHFNISSANFSTDFLENKDEYNIWVASASLTYPARWSVPCFNHPIFKILFEAKASGADHSICNLTTDETKQFWGHFFKNTLPLPEFPPEIQDLIYNSPGYYSYTAIIKTVSLSINNYSGYAYTKSEEAVIMRFGKVFAQTYTRFNDLQKAEEQAREASIEAALERVRSRTMAMQKSGELAQVIQLTFEQFVHLGIKVDSASFNMDHRADNNFRLWIATPEQRYPSMTFTPYFDHPVFNIPRAAKDAGLDHFVTKLTFSEKNQLWDHFFKNSSPIPDEPAHVIDRIYNAPGFYGYGVLMKTVALTLVNYWDYAYTDAEEAVIMRFGKVFEQTYTRFNDLQKAEAQAREAQIEGSLERVRSRTMGMQKSEELSDVIQLIYNQFVLLHFNISAANFSTDFLEVENEYNIWVASANLTQPARWMVPFFDHPVFSVLREAKKTGVEYAVCNLTTVETKQFWEYFFKSASPLPDYLPEIHDRIYNSVGYYSYTAIIKTVSLSIINYAGYAYTEAEQAVVMRFCKVFEQTYTRFKDLEQAEAQAREGQIQLALERVRSRTMAMQKSEELAEVIQLVYEQLVHLNFIITTASFSLDYRNGNFAFTWMASQIQNFPSKITWPMFDHPLFNDALAAINGGLDSYATKLTFDEKNQMLDHWFSAASPLPNYTQAEVDLFYDAPDYNSYSVVTKNVLFSIFNYSSHKYTEAEQAVVMRFGKVFEQTYTRFLDLQTAEARAREAVKQASLDRVRAEIASMRSTNDLDRITPLVWNELTMLGVPFIRCGVFIVDEEAAMIHTHLSTPDGNAIAAFDQPIDAGGIGLDVLPAWRKKQIATMHWSAEEFAEYTKTLVMQGTVASSGKYVTERPDTSLDLHFFPFLQGMLYVGNTEPLQEDARNLVQSLADAFSTAYARYEDFIKLQAAKRQVDEALTELKATQNQLVQAEKMASLGELTAGIAHEIQNPLNFVNNFSEVSKELLDEMESELNKGDMEEAKAISADIKQNLEKINHHGKRADAIVKSMLQHSRKSTGQKEPTDINKLADEYLRLAYQGLRAKDKSFNTILRTNFDETIGQVNMVPQDIGRVLLNMFNNAFYAVHQQCKIAGASYQPEVSVTTETQNGQVTIMVKDNGTGMPNAVKEKIMQPFFTTKPTGEGTGLGLSLSYDIVKAHGGEIRVESKEGEGSVFLIVLPY